MAALLQLTQEALSSELALQVLDCALHTLAVNDDLEGPALDGVRRIGVVSRVVQGTGNVSNLAPFCKPKLRDNLSTFPRHFEV